MYIYIYIYIYIILFVIIDTSSNIEWILISWWSSCSMGLWNVFGETTLHFHFLTVLIINIML